jgi:hypothetical protein
VERDIGETDSREKDMRETVATCLFNRQLVIYIQIRGDSGSLRSSQS